MRGERPRAPRYPFTAHLLLNNLDINLTTRTRTCDLSSFGCRIAPGISALTGTRVRIQITYKGDIFEAFGKVANVRKDGSAGIAFTKVEPHDQLILDEWIAALRNAKAEGLLKGA